jgi:gluconolactonase
MKCSRSLILAVAMLACASDGAIGQGQTSGTATALPAGGFGGMRGDGPAPKPQPFSFTRADPAFDELVSHDAKVELVANGFKLDEGTTWVRERGGRGFLLVAGLLDNVLYKVTPDGTVSVFMEKAGYTGDDVDNVGAQTRAGRSHVLLIGPSCSGVDPQGRILWCADNDRQIMRLEKDGTHTVLSSGANGKRFNGPNDISIKADGAIYVTDNDFGLRGATKSPDKQMADGVWLIKDGKTTRLLTDTQLGGIPNGITLSPDGKYLYLSAGFSKMMRYPVKRDDTLGPGQVFTRGVGIGDGMRADTEGNIYSTNGAGPGIVRITSPAGRFLGSINLPIVGKEPKVQICATNLAFGDNDGKTLYIAACDAVYKVRLKVSGVLEGPAPR